MSDALWIALGVAVAVWLFWPRSNTKAVEQSARSPSEPDEQPTSDPHELEVAKARHAREQIEEEEEASIQRHHESMEGVRQKLARARKYMCDTGLDRAIPEVWDMVHYWPSWVDRPDQWTPPEGVTEITGGGEMKESWAAWRWHDHHYKMSFAERNNYIPDDYDRLGEISLDVDGEAVCTMDCSQGMEDYGGWRFTGVEALKVGPWMSEFVRMAGYLRAEQSASTRQTFSEMDRERASRIDLGD